MWDQISKYLTTIHIPRRVELTDVIEILVISFLIYHLMVWVKNTKAWSLFKGVIVILVFVMIAALFDMTTILWIVNNVLSIAVIAVVIVLQPELRRALEQLGQKNIFSNFLVLNNTDENGRFSDKTLNEIVKACYAMGRVKTGALIVMERNQSLVEYERTGIAVDGIVTSQLLINIFEHNTPLHDGAVIVRGDRITSATCYLPLSDNDNLSKELGTRHRAGVGISEATDALTIIVSEETGRVSVTQNGELYRNIDADELKQKLIVLQGKVEDDKKHRRRKGKAKDEKEANA